MANSVDLVIGSEAIKQVEILISKLSLADAELLKISQSAMGASKGISGISTPSGLDKTVSSTSALNAQLEKQNAIITKLHADLAKKAEQSRLAEIRLQQQREKAFDSFEKKAQKEAALNAKNEGAYQRIQNSVNLLTKAYNDLAIKKQLGGTLTAKEEVQLTSLTTRISTYQKALLATDATIGKNQRNVGNYASGYNALGNSINQLSREAPAFANSVNTGFMALSNNFPALFDAINGIRDKNKMLIAEGKPTTSVLKSIAGAVFSWQTALSAGVTLLTLYGGQFVKWVMEMSKGKETISDLKLRMDTLNKSFEESSVKEAVKNVQELVINIDLAKRGFLDKQKVVDQYNETIGKTTGLVSSLDEAEAELVKNGDAYIKMTLYKAASNLALEEAAKQSLAAEKSRVKSLKEFSNAFLDADLSQTRSKEQYDAKQANLQNQLKKRQAEEVKINEDAANQNINIAKKFQSDAAKIAKDFDFNFFGDTKKEKVKKQQKEKREDLEFLESYVKPVGNIVEEINAQIENLKVIRITGTPEEREEAKKDIETLIELKKQLMGGSPTGGALPDFVVPDNAPAQAKLKTDWKDTFNDIAESAQKAGDIIAGFSERNFDNEYARLEAQKDISLKFAGDSAEAKAKIEEDYDKKRKEIANRENKAKQKQAVFNIGIDIAQAIVGLWAKPGFPAAIPLVATVAALGAAQIALVASQKIPQYFDGTDNHIGGMMLVNDGAGANFQEKVILPNGKEIMPEGRNVLMNAPAGTKVLNHEQQIMEMLNERGISMHKSYQSNGMTANEMDSVIAKHFAKIQTNNTTFDRKGFRSWSEINGNKTIQNNNRVSRTGFNV